MPRLLPALLSLACLPLVTGPPRAAAREPFERNTLLDLSGGVQVPFDGDNRDAWGTGQAFSVGLATRNTGTSWLFIDAGLLHTAGRESLFDPTFEISDTDFWLVPLTLGIRWSTTHSEARHTRLYLGLGMQTWLTWYDPPAGRTLNGAAIGFMGEWRHEIDLSGPAALFLRQRILLTTSQSYGNRIPDTGFSGTTLEIGLCNRLH